jgi:hypothetical protein
VLYFTTCFATDGVTHIHRVDMGTCDELSLDVLLNMLMGYSQDFAGLKNVSHPAS